MAALWTYPFTIGEEGLNEACEQIIELGVKSLNVSSHYHSVRLLQPRFPNALFQQFPGGCHFAPADKRFSDIPINPPVVDIDGFEDPLAEITDAAHEHGLAVNSWIVCLHNSQLGSMNPTYRIESAFGDCHDHSLCPSYPDVRDYFAAVVEATVERSVDEIQLESIGFPSAFHSHGSEYGHDKRQVLTGSTETVLLSQCFCDGCRNAAKSHTVDFDRAKARVQEILESVFANPTIELPSLKLLIQEEEIFRSLFNFRATVIETFIERLADASGAVPLNYYVAESLGGTDPNGIWSSGVKLDQLNAYLDRMTAVCYVSDPSTAQDRVRTLQQLIDCPVDAGLTLDPSVVETVSDLQALFDTLNNNINGRLSFYHHSLMTNTQLHWVKSVLEEQSWDIDDYRTMHYS